MGRQVQAIHNDNTICSQYRYATNPPDETEAVPTFNPFSELSEWIAHCHARSDILNECRALSCQIDMLDLILRIALARTLKAWYRIRLVEL